MLINNYIIVNKLNYKTLKLFITIKILSITIFNSQNNCGKGL